jgi:AcrR family transcriptional regulator
MSVRHFAAELGINDGAVSNWERRKERANLRYETQQLLDTLLARASDEVRQRFRAQLVAGDPTVDAGRKLDGDESEDGRREGETNRRQLLAAGIALPGAALIVGGPGADPVDAPDKLLATIIDAYRRLERGRSSRLLMKPVAGCVELIRHVIQRDSAAGPMHAVLSEAAGLAAWLCSDLVDADRARRYYRLAVATAEQSGHGCFRCTCGRVSGSSRPKRET